MLKARICQATGDYATSLKLFEEARKYDPESTVINFGIGQTQIYQGNVSNACNAFERVLESEENSYETRKILASLYAMTPETKPKALNQFEHLKKLLKSYEEEDCGLALNDDSFIKDPEMLLELAMLSENDSIKSSLKNYCKVLKLLEENGTDPQPEILNNIAALYQLDAENESDNIILEGAKSNLEAAESLYERAMHFIINEDYMKNENPQRLDTIQTTLRYNIARLNESKCDIVKAKKQYRDILSIHPAHIDCNPP